MAGEADDAVAWVHLSDFHFKTGHDYGRDEVQHALLEDIAMFAGKRDPARGAEPLHLDFIVVTGDIAGSGTADEYVVGERFLRELAGVAGVPADRIFPVPGNHDVDWTRDMPPFLREHIVGRERVEEVWKTPASRRSVFADKLAAYRAFVSRLNPQLRIPEEQPGGFGHRVPRS